MSKIHTKTSMICPICMNNIEGSGIILHKTRRQTHRLCTDCGETYINYKLDEITNNIRHNIKNENNYFLLCPGLSQSCLRNQCRKVIYLKDIIVDPKSKLYTDIFRIIYTLKTPCAFICINKTCNQIIETQEYINPIICSSCDSNFCKYCLRSPYHEGKSCIEIDVDEQKTDNSKLIKQKIIDGKIKYCPLCRVPVEKEHDENGNFLGCNKIYCYSCKATWCWLCETTNIDYSHYNEKNASKCSNKLWKGTKIL